MLRIYSKIFRSLFFAAFLICNSCAVFPVPDNKPEESQPESSLVNSSENENISGTETVIKEADAVQETPPEPGVKDTAKTDQDSSDYVSEAVQEAASGEHPVEEHLMWASPEAGPNGGDLPEPVFKRSYIISPEPVFSGKVITDESPESDAEIIVLIDESEVPVRSGTSLKDDIPSDSEKKGEAGVGPVQVTVLDSTSAEKNISESAADTASRDVTASPGSEVVINMDGLGWIYISGGNENLVEYLGREYADGATVFKFLPLEEGDPPMVFERQNLSEGSFSREVVRLKISKSGPAADDDSISSGNNSDAEISQAQKDDSSDIISLQEKINAALETDDPSSVDRLVPDLLKSSDPVIIEKYPSLGFILYEADFYSSSALLLKQFLTWNSVSPEMDRILFVLGRIYETDPEIHDEIAAAGYYKELVDSYPASIYWEKAEGRYLFLRRRYIDIR